MTCDYTHNLIHDISLLHVLKIMFFQGGSFADPCQSGEVDRGGGSCTHRGDSLGVS